MERIPTNPAEHIERSQVSEGRALERIKEVRGKLDAFEQRIGEGKLGDDDCDTLGVILGKLMKELDTAF